MPLTAKGKKLKKKFKEQYGKKKGEKVFYAMENSGKLKKVIKAASGRDAGMGMGGKSRGGGRSAPGPGDTGGAGGYDKDTRQFGKVGSSPTSTGGGRPRVTVKTPPTVTKNPPTLFQAVKGPTPFMGFNFLKNVVFDPMTRYGREQKAKGETLITQKAVTLPATREYYRTTEKPLDVMSKEGKQYMKDAGLLSDPKVTPPSNSGQDKMCPDGTMPPCVKPSVTKMPTPTSSTGSSSSSNFLKDFIFYPLKSGGISSGPPPKKGPNSQVPPVKLSKGGGAAIRGTKFKGVF
jgi:hypothetical protein